MLGPKQTTWKILYSRFEGPERRAVELLNREVGRRVIRKAGTNQLHVLPCEAEKAQEKIDGNVIVVGTRSESPIAARFVEAAEIPAGGYAVKVVADPGNEEARIVVITAEDPERLADGAVAFIDDYPARHVPIHGGLQYPDRIFDFDLPPDLLASAPGFKARSVFAWGHTLNDYRSYLRDLARLRMNRLILWNDVVPLNIADIIRTAHAYGIEVFAGFAWGWIDGCAQIQDIGPKMLADLQASVIRNYEENYRDAGYDGVYFQSFTERADDTIGGRQIAGTVTDFVNATAAELLALHPALKIEFGLHAQSVWKHLGQLARVDPRVEILWEDCGAFPYSYLPVVKDEAAYLEAERFTDRLIDLRPGAPLGLAFKGLATIDWWGGFVTQRGRFLLGENVPEMTAHDRALRDDAWRTFSAQWVRYGRYALRLARHVHERTGDSTHLCMVGLLDGGRWLPEALCAEIFWSPLDEWDDLLERVMKRPGLQIG